MQKKLKYTFLFLIFIVLGQTGFAQLNLDGTIKHVSGCYGESNGFIKLYAEGGTPEYTYTINNWQTSQATGDFLNLPSGNYTVKVRDANNDEASMYIELTQPDEFMLSGHKTNVTGCFGDNNGTISLAATGGIEPYQYSVNNGLNFYETAIFFNLGEGYYDVIAHDKNNCSKSFQVYISEPEKLTISDLVSANVFPCHGDKNGKLTISPSGGTGNYSYSLNNTDFSSNNVFENLSPGNFTAYVKDENNCSAQADFTINEPELLIIDTLLKQNLSCFNSNDGSIEIRAHGGTPPLAYSGNGISFQSENNFTQLAAGTYSTQVKDINGCNIQKQITLFQEDELLISETHENLICNGENTGKIILNASGGAGNYLYSINSGSNFQSGNIFSGLSAKNYDIIIKDADNCSKSLNLSLTEPSPIVFNSIEEKDLICNGDNSGEITINTQGGTGTHFYSINGGESFQNNNRFTGLAAEYFPIVVQDENFCKKTGSVSLGEPVFNTTYQKSDLDCFNDNDAYISFNTYGSNPPFRFSIDAGNTFQEVTTFVNLSGGRYHCIVKDIKNCQKQFEIEIVEPEQLVLHQEINSGCSNGDNISINMLAQGGTKPYQYSINGGLNYQSEPFFGNLTIGTYNLKVIDDNFCFTDKTTTIESPNDIKLSIETKDLSCFNDKSGEIHLHVSGGVKPYAFSKDNGAIYGTDSSFYNLASAEYQIAVKDRNNCQNVKSITLNQPEKLKLILEEHNNIESCFGDSVGSFLVSSTGGTGIKQFSIDLQNYSENGLFENLSAGEYLVSVKDENFCESNITVKITQPELLKINSISKTDIENCYGDQSGQIQFNVSGGTLPLVFSINGGQSFHSTTLFENLTAGDFNLYVRDSKQCTDSTKVTIKQPDELVLDFNKQNISCYGKVDGKIELFATGGTGTVNFSVDNGNSFSAKTFYSSLTAGNYTLIAKDDNNCSTSPQGTQIKEPEALIFSLIEKTDLQCDKINGGIISAQAKGGTGTIYYSIDLSAQQTNGLFENLSAGIHTVFIEDDNFCKHSKQIELLSSDANCIEIPTAFTPNEDGINDTWEIRHLQLYPNAGVQIYDRNGNTITRYNSGDTGWNGTFNGNRMPMGSYWYKIKLTKDTPIISGYLTLVR